MTYRFDRRVLVGLAALAIGVTAAVPTPACAQGKEPLRLGVTFPITGPAAQAGASGMMGVKLAVKDINDAGGIAGRPINMIVADDRLDTTQAVSEAKRLTGQEHIEMLVGGAASQVAMAIMPVVTEAKIPYITFVGTNALTPEAAPYGFSSSPPQIAQATVDVGLLKDVLKAKSVAILSDDGIFSKVWVGQFHDLLAPIGITISGTQEFQLGAAEMTSQILALRRTNPDALIVSANTAPDVGHVLAGLAEVGWDIKVLGSTSLASFVDGAKRVAGPDSYKNVYGPQFKTFSYCPNDPPSQSPVVTFVNQIKTADPQNWQQISPETAAGYYASVYLLKAAVEANGGKTDGPTIANWIETAGSGALNLLVGTPRASKISHFVYGTESLTVVQHLDQRRDSVLQQRVGC